MPKKAIIIGAGPAGLTAAYELLKRTDIKPILIEKCNQVGGISKTVDYKGNKMDFGPHRFFSKSDRVMNWWTNIMPLHTPKGKDVTISYQNKSRTIDTGDFLTTDEEDGLPPAKSMLVIPRLTRIYFLRQFFAYPIQLSIATLGQLGLGTTIKIVFSYLYARLFPRKPEKSLEDFMINKFGSVLYHIFFKDYTEKVWGMDCNKISAEWGAQRIKGVSLSKAVIHAAKALTKKKKKVDKTDIHQKDTETSLIEQFLYPAQGAGAMWEEVARQVEDMGGKIVSNYDVKQIFTEGDQITGIEALNTLTWKLESLEGDYFISTMPIQELIAGLKGNVPEEVKEVAAGLIYRDFVYAGVLVKKMTMKTPTDSWIYIQEKDVKVARMQVYNNWGPYMVADPNTVWLGLEYFCTKGDAIWNMTDEEVKQMAITELIKMDLVTVEHVLDATVNRMEKTYPAYFGTYDRFDVIREYLDNFSNLFLVGRNGMHKYNNADHSMLTAMVAVDNICEGVLSKENLWSINTEQEYHEEKQTRSEISKPDNTTSTPKIQFTKKDFIQFASSSSNKKLIVISTTLLLLGFCIFKFLYPYPFFINGDSYVYIQTAAENHSINTYPIGYSMFLRLVSVFTKSDAIIIIIQFLTFEIALVFFMFTIFLISGINKLPRAILYTFLSLNPMFLILSNYISSDILFITLTLSWITTLLWMIYIKSRHLMLIHCLLLFLCFIVRYNAIVYPMISVIAVAMCNFSIRKKITIIVLPALLILTFIISTSYQYKQQTNKWQFSPFSGWQMANNALYAYRFVDSIERKPVPTKFINLHNSVNNYFKAAKDTSKYPHEKELVSTYYMWSRGMPLHDYMNILYNGDSTIAGRNRWASIGPFYKEYGLMLMRQYPSKYIKHYLWPNLIRYYAPPEEFLMQNNNKDSIHPDAVKWFGYKVNHTYSRVGNYNLNVVSFMPILSGTLNFIFVFITLGMLLLGSAKSKNKLYTKFMALLILFWGINLAFSVFASPITLRYQIFPFVVTLVCTVIMIENLWNIYIELSNSQRVSKNVLSVG